MPAPTTTDPKGDEGSPPPPRHHLLVLGPEGALPVQLPDEGVLTIGRDDEADVRLNDPRASRLHARLHIGETFELEDLGSANGTIVGDRRLDVRESVTVAFGEAIAIGDTVLTLERRRPGFEARRVWAHGYLETRLIEECARAQSRGAPFALVRLHVDERAPSSKVERMLGNALRPGNLLATYGPHEYEVLFPDTDEAGAREQSDGLVATLAGQRIAVRAAHASFPTDGTSPQRLMTAACERVRGKSTAPAAALVVESRDTRELYALARRTAAGDANVLIVGEAGSGKELLAEGIHRLSPRGDRAFVTLDCAAFDEPLLERELFGFERATFADAPEGKVGVLEAASGGTLLLDDIAEMPLAIQGKLLRAIEAGQVLRMGAQKPRPIDVRFIASSTRQLTEDVAESRFRQDLLSRLDPFSLEIPPLRERTEEITSLARLFLKRLAPPGRSPVALSPAALALMRAYSWPGNIRELRNVVERAALLCKDGTITEAQLPADRMRRSAWPLVPSPVTAPITQTMAAIPMENTGNRERQAMVDALRRCHGNSARAAELMGMPRRRFHELMTEYKIPRPRT